MTQVDIIHNELRKGSTVTKLTALHNNIGNIHEVIRRLRAKGVDVRTVTGVDPRGRKYTKYALAK